MPSAGHASQPDPVLPLYAAWQAATLELDQYSYQPDDLIDEAVETAPYDKRYAALKALMATNATTVEGALCLARASWTEDGPQDLMSEGQHAYGWGEYRLLQRIILFLETITAQHTQPALCNGCWAVAEF
ncbi:MAG: hypothetical protein AAF701_08100 [Pseudomonadota bacterium]